MTAGVRLRLALLVWLGMLPLLLLLLLTMREQAEEARARAYDELSALSVVASGRFQAWLEGSAQLLESLALLPEVREGRLAEVDRIFRHLVRPDSPLQTLGLARPDGAVLVSTVAIPPSQNLADRDYFRELLASRALATGNLTFGRLTGRPVLPIAAPALDVSGDVRAVVFGGLNLTSLSQSLESIRVPKNTTLAFVDRAGRLLVRNPAGRIRTGQGTAADPLYAQVVVGEPGPVEDTGPDGVRRVAAGAPMLDLQGRTVGYVILTAPVRDLYGGAVDIYRRGLFVVLLTGGVTFLLALFGGEVLLRRPLVNLCTTVSRLGAGELRARSGLAGAPGVLGLLGRTFDRMAGQLEREILRSRLLLEAAGEGILGLDAHGRITFANRAAARILRTDPERLQGRILHELVHAEDHSHPASECPLLAPSRTGRPRNAVVDEFQCGDGTSLPVEWTGTPLEEPSDRTCEVFLFSDISRRLGLERQLHHALKMEVLGRLAASVAHDFNNVLTVLQGNSEFILREEADPSNSRQAAEEIARACSRGKGLTEQLLALSRPRPKSRQVVELNSMLHDFQGVLKRLVGEDVDLRCRLYPRPVVAEVDLSQLEHWLLNLAANARDAMPRGGLLVLETRVEEVGHGDPHLPAGTFGTVHVRDTGTGMPPEVLERAFEPFFTTKPEGKGTGLGLPTLRAQVQEHGGGIRVESTPGRGTCISIYLPLSAAGAPVPVDEVPETPTSGRERVLVVDDDDSVRSLMARALRGAGYQVMEASRPERVLEELRRHGQPMDLLVTDMVMPGLSGTALWHALRHEPLGPRRVIFISGYSSERFETGEAGIAGAYLEKPFNLKQLLTAVRQQLDEPPEA